MEKVEKVVKKERKLKKLTSMKMTPKRKGVVRPPHKERAWKAVQSAPFVAEKLRREAPDPDAFRTNKLVKSFFGGKSKHLLLLMR